MKVNLINGQPFLNTSIQLICEHTNTPHHRQLNEADYKEIQMFIDKSFLKQQVRADALEGVVGPSVEDESLIFRVKSSKHKDNRLVYSNIVKLHDWPLFIEDNNYTSLEKARALMLQGNISVHCTCPSFLFWGYQYLLTQIDAAMVPEKRPPNIRNPQQRGIICKHLNRTFRSYPFFIGDFAKYINKNHPTTKKDVVSDKGTELTKEAFMSDEPEAVYEDLLKWNRVAIKNV
tara:strand:- start:465 stop:1160 length:696 start_codon:yes stop_codon:yes gene_type:complete